jgi:hypothetical protein
MVMDITAVTDSAMLTVANRTATGRVVVRWVVLQANWRADATTAVMTVPKAVSDVHRAPKPPPVLRTEAASDVLVAVSHQVVVVVRPRGAHTGVLQLVHHREQCDQVQAAPAARLVRRPALHRVAKQRRAEPEVQPAPVAAVLVQRVVPVAAGPAAAAFAPRVVPNPAAVAHVLPVAPQEVGAVAFAQAVQAAGLVVVASVPRAVPAGPAEVGLRVVPAVPQVAPADRAGASF